MTTLEEAGRCPKCGFPGDHRVSRPGPKNSSIRNYFCMNERCTWFDTSWLVQVNADGTIPERKQGVKEFDKLTVGEEAMARRIIEDAIQSDLRDSKNV